MRIKAEPVIDDCCVECGDVCRTAEGKYIEILTDSGDVSAVEFHCDGCLAGGVVK